LADIRSGVDHDVPRLDQVCEDPALHWLINTPVVDLALNMVEQVAGDDHPVRQYGVEQFHRGKHRPESLDQSVSVAGEQSGTAPDFEQKLK
jgi:hypothetical protein